MNPEVILAYEFVEFIPDELKEGTLYISVIHCTAAHKCCCGCGREVVTPLSPTAWQLIFDGKTVSLYPSIGSWSLSCQSHYLITKNKVIWAPKWTKKQIARGRVREAKARQKYYAKTQSHTGAAMAPSGSPSATTKSKESDAARREAQPKLPVEEDQPKPSSRRWGPRANPSGRNQ